MRPSLAVLDAGSIRPAEEVGRSWLGVGTGTGRVLACPSYNRGLGGEASEWDGSQENAG